MKKILQIIITLMLFQAIPVMAQSNQTYTYAQHRQAIKDRQQEIDEMLDSRLHLTQEQKDYIQKNRPVHMAQMKEIVDRMQVLHDDIRKIYQSNLPKMQADIKAAPLKTELGILKQNAYKLKEESKKNFENILTDEQKIEFEKIKKEFSKKNNKS